MFTRTRILPMAAVLLATFMAFPAFAKVPFRAREHNRENVTQMTTHAAMHLSKGRYGHVKQFRPANHGRACTHAHRFNGQHWM